MANKNIKDNPALAGSDNGHAIEVQSGLDNKNYYVLWSDLKYYCNGGLTLPSSDFSGVSDAETLTNKSINADNNTITNIVDSNIKSTAGINASKIANGEVSNTEFQYLKGVSSKIQDQINDLKPTTATMLVTADGSKNINIKASEIRTHLGITESLQYAIDWTSFDISSVTKDSTGIDETPVSVTRTYITDNSVQHLDYVDVEVGTASVDYYVRILNIKFKDARLGYNTGSIT